jgi:membrane protease YdiL (CAAX protease family)
MEAQGDPAQTMAYEPRSRLRRLVEVTAFWAAWAAIGQVFHLGDSAARQNVYLLIGIPLVYVFQVWVAKRDVRELWVRTAPAVVVTRLVASIAFALAIFPAITLVRQLVDGQPAAFAIYSIAAVAGAGFAAYAFGLFERKAWKYLGLCILFGTGYSILIQAVGDYDLFLSHRLTIHPSSDLETVLSSLLTYIPALFVMEEVAFRGAFDSHLHHPGERHGFWSALYISVLWSLWHAPILGWDHAIGFLVSMVPTGIVFSIYWRRSGNLGVSVGAHALADSVRNAITGIP